MDVIGTFNLVDSVTNHATTPALNGATYTKTVEINGITYVYVAGALSHGIQVFSLASDGTLTAVASMLNSTPIELAGISGLDIVQVGSEYFLAATAYNGSALSMFRIDDDGVGTDGHLIHLENYRNIPITGQPTDAQGLVSSPTSIDGVTVGGNTYYVMSSYGSDAISVYEVGASGGLTRTDSILDSESATYQIDQPWALDTHAIGNQTFVIAGAYGGDSGFSVFRLTSAGQLIDVQDVLFAEQRSVRDIVALEINGKHYVVVANTNGYDMLVYEMATDGTMTFLAATNMNDAYSLWDIENIEPLTVDGVEYLLATSGANDTLAVFSIDPTGVPILVESISSAIDLNNADDIHVQQMGSRTFVLVTGYDGDSLAVYEIGANDDPLVGTMAADRIVGQNGDDDLLGRAGNDLLLGGNGNDVLSGHKGADMLIGGSGFDILSGGAGDDTLEGGAGPDVLIGGAGIDLISYVRSSVAVTINLSSGLAEGGDAAGDIFTLVEGVIGSRFDDSLTGDGARNSLSGGNGADLLNGLGGNDTLSGEGGNDRAFGGAGKDRLILGDGKDLGNGGAGNDRIDGGRGNDRLIGGNGNDDLNGGAGADTLIGGLGNDALNGAAGADVFVFDTNHGGDTVEDFQVNVDRIDLTGHTGFNSFADVLAGSSEFSGNTLIGSGSNSIVLLDVTRAELDQGDFLF